MSLYFYQFFFAYNLFCKKNYQCHLFYIFNKYYLKHNFNIFDSLDQYLITLHFIRIGFIWRLWANYSQWNNQNSHRIWQ